MKMISIVGRRYGKLEVKEFLGTRKRKNRPGTVSWWRCLCDCGKETSLPKSSLISGLTTSCGCTLRDATIASNIRRRKFNSAFRNLLCRYKNTARKKGLEFTLTDEQFRTLTSSPCHWTGRSPSRKVTTKCHHDEYIYNGIDRLDSEQGYTLENCVSSCYDANSAKSTLSVEEFLQLCHEVVEHHSRSYGMD